MPQYEKLTGDYKDFAALKDQIIAVRNGRGSRTKEIGKLATMLASAPFADMELSALKEGLDKASKEGNSKFGELINIAFGTTKDQDTKRVSVFAEPSGELSNFRLKLTKEYSTLPQQDKNHILLQTATYGNEDECHTAAMSGSLEDKQFFLEKLYLVGAKDFALDLYATMCNEFPDQARALGQTRVQRTSFQELLTGKKEEATATLYNAIIAKDIPKAKEALDNPFLDLSNPRTSRTTVQDLLDSPAIGVKSETSTPMLFAAYKTGNKEVVTAILEKIATLSPEQQTAIFENSDQKRKVYDLGTDDIYMNYRVTGETETRTPLEEAYQNNPEIKALVEEARAKAAPPPALEVVGTKRITPEVNQGMARGGGNESEC